ERLDRAAASILALADKLQRSDFFGPEAVRLQKAKETISQTRTLEMELRKQCQVIVKTEESQYKNSEESANYYQKLTGILGFVVSCVCVACAIALGSMFLFGVTSRIQLLTDNILRFARGDSLHPRISGADEIAELDSAFHQMASIVADASEKERAIIFNARDLICRLDEAGTFGSVNPAVKDILGYEEDEVIGSRFVRFVMDDNRDRFLANLTDHISGQKTEPFETRLIHKTGKTIHLFCSCHWSENEKSLFCVMHDITANKEAEQLRQELLAMVTHDIRSPLTSVSLSLTSMVEMEEENLTASAFRTLKRSKTELDRLVRLANCLLDIERLESGIIELDMSLESVSNIVQIAIDAVAGLCEIRGVRLESSVEETKILCDADRIVQVVINLLSNAIKFSPKNGQLLIKATQVDDRMRFEVFDEGPGIAAEDQSKLFQQFSQLDQLKTLRKTGSGLGLFIARRLVEAHGGRIGYLRPEKGSCFWFEIPVSQ
ncbi:MAG: PAS domain S-box protein, partial [Cyanobacteria bacterium]|nr:PAS domain S-box protein [Cyanobacteriota bacterium]